MVPFIIRKLDRRYYTADIPLHPTRLQAYSFFFLLSGTVLVEIGEKGYLIKQGELVIIPVGQFFAIKYFDRSEGYMGSFSPNYFGEDVSERNIFKRFDFLRVWGHPVIEFGKERAETVARKFVVRIRCWVTLKLFFTSVSGRSSRWMTASIWAKKYPPIWG